MENATYNINGESYGSLQEVALRFQTNKFSLLFDLEKGYSIEEALGIVEKREIKIKEKPKPKINKIKPKKKLKGKTGEEIIKDIAKRRKRPYTPRKRVPKNIIEFHGKSFSSASELARFYEIKPSTYFARIKRGETQEEALELVPVERKEKVKYFVNGKSYETLTSLAQEYNILPQTLRSRLNSGVKIEDAVLDKIQSSGGKKPLIIDGIEFESYKMASKEFQVSEGKISYRINNGYSPRQAVGLDPIKGSNKKVKLKVGGKVFASISDAASFYGLDKSVVARRLREGWTPEEALLLVKRKRNIPIERQVEFQGKIYKSLADLARKHNVDPRHYLTRIKSGETQREALDLDSSERDLKEHYEFEGEKFKSLSSLSKKYGISSQTLSYRLKQGMSLEEAVYAKVQNRGAKRSLTIEGIEYSSFVEVAEKFNISPATVAYRANSGWSPNEIAGIEKRKRAPSIKEIRLEGLIFRSISAAAEYCKVDRAWASAELRKGKTPEEVFLNKLFINREEKRRKIKWKN